MTDPRPRPVPNRSRALALLAAAAVASLAAPASAEVLRLENGRSMHGTIDRGYLDPDFVRIQLFATGGTVKVRWEHLISEDRDRYQIDLGLKEDEEAQELKVDGHKVEFKNMGSAPRFGLVLNPEAMDAGASAMVRLQTDGKLEEYPAGQIAKISDARLDLVQVYTPIQAYEIRRDEIQPVTGRGHYDLAEYARRVGAYEAAKEHYLEAKADPDFAETALGKTVESRLARLDLLIRNSALQDQIDGLKRGLIVARAQRNFQKAATMYLDIREEMFRMMQEHTEKELQKEFRMVELATRVEAERRAFFQKNMAPEVYRRIKELTYAKAREQKEKNIPPGISRQERAVLEAKGTYQGARQYAQRQLLQELWDSLLKDVGASRVLAELQATAEKDPSKITEEDRKRMERMVAMEKSLKQDLADFWANRNKNINTTTSFGYGSFIILKRDAAAGRKAAGAGGAGGNQGGNRGGNAGNRGGTTQKAVAATTPEQWWDQASTKEKQDWLLSYFAKFGGFLEVIRDWEVPCESCAGLGYKVSQVAGTGEAEATRCTVCNGADSVLKIKWR